MKSLSFPMQRLSIFCALLFVLGIPACGGGSDASRITRVLNECAKIGSASARYGTGTSAQAKFIADAFQKMNVSKCPPEFRMAFQAHTLAWRQASVAYANNTMTNGFIEGALAGLTNDNRYFGQSVNNAAYATQQINETYYYLTQVAAAYGARIPVSVSGQ